MFKAVQELNEEVVKNNEGILVDFTEKYMSILEDKQCYIVNEKDFIMKMVI